MGTNNEPVLVDETLLRRAEEVSRKRLLNDPKNRVALRSLAQICRKQGNLEEAAAAYARLVDLDPDDREASYVNAIFNGREWPAAPEGTIPAPFVLKRNLLSGELHQSLLPLVVSVQDRLVPATVGNNEYNPDTRESLDLPNPLQWEVMRRFNQGLKKFLPTLQPRLNIPSFDIGTVEFKVRVYKDGHFFRTHMDSPAKSEKSSFRRLSYVYFFHKLPRPFTGGDLVLFDTDITSDTFTNASFTRITPEDNTLVVFPSPYYHCVVPLRCQSDDFTDSRFVVNGHVCERARSPIETPQDQAVAT